MNNIIIFLQIISVFIFIYLILSKTIKQNLKIAIPILALIILSSYYLYMPIRYNLISELNFTSEEISSSIEMMSYSTSIDKYRILSEDNKQLIDILKNYKYKPTSYNSGHQTDNTIILYLENTNNGAVIYSLFINTKTNKAKLLNSGKGRDFDFEADDILIKYVQELSEKYENAFTDEHNSVELKTTITTIDDEKTRWYTYQIENQSNFWITDVYLYKKYKDEGSAYSTWRDIDDSDMTYTCEFPVQLEDKNTKSVVLVVRGIKVENGNSFPFQKVININ